jgi:hypothetical protein
MDRPDVGLSGRQQALDEQIEKLNENLGQLWALELDGLWKMLDVVADSVREHGVPLIGSLGSPTVTAPTWRQRRASRIRERSTKPRRISAGRTRSGGIGTLAWSKGI